MTMDEKSLIVDELLELMKNSRLNQNQKIQIMNLIDEEDRATDNEKERFALYYGLNVNGRQNMKLIQIASLYGRSISSIRNSISSMRRKLINYTDEMKFSIIENIVKECRMEIDKVG